MSVTKLPQGKPGGIEVHWSDFDMSWAAEPGRI